MSDYALYGSMISVDDAKNLIEKLFSIFLEPRASDYQGGDYYRSGQKDGENFEIRRNCDPYDSEPVEMNFAEFPTLLYINSTLRLAWLQKAFGEHSDEFTLLRVEKFN